MEAICSSETSVDSQRTTRRYTRISEYGTLHNHRIDNLKSYNNFTALWLKYYAPVLN
jgi:uncharacterized protein YqiB (DUF1249 family)